ncbi:MAG: CoA transferase [Chloroflexi bacterium]|nr:CoA transferase [Chloroflexota bacterium]
MAAERAQPLEGVTVVDVSRYLSGPTATMLLGDLGAAVIKVEGLPRGDSARESGPFQDAESVYFMASNRNKRSIAVDLRHPDGLALVRRLAGRADVFVQNFKPGTVEKMGLGFEDLASLNPRLVYCSISGFGVDGAGRNLPGFDQSAQAMSGLMSVTGTEQTGPLRVGIAIGDSSAGVFAALGIVTALFQRERTGVGQHVRTSLMESLLSLLSYQAQKYLSLGMIPGQDGNDHPLMFPQGTFHAQDGPFTIASGNDAMWRTLCGIVEAPDLGVDPRFQRNADRMRNRVLLRTILEERFRARPVAYWLEAINRAGIPAAPIYDIEQALMSAITADLSMVVEADHATLGRMKLLGTPVKVGDADLQPRSGPPVLGQHTVEICREAGLTDEETARLLGAHVVRSAGAPT